MKNPGAVAPVVGMGVVIHRGSIPGTDIGRRWFRAGGELYGVDGWPHGLNKGWSYEIVDCDGRTVDESCFSLDEVRDWAADREAEKR